MKHTWKIAGKAKYDRIRNAQTRGMMEQEILMTTLDYRQLNWFGFRENSRGSNGDRSKMDEIEV